MNSFKELCVHFEARRKSSSCIVGHFECARRVCYGHKYAKLSDKNKPSSVRAVVDTYYRRWRVKRRSCVRTYISFWSIVDVYSIRWVRRWFFFVLRTCRPPNYLHIIIWVNYNFAFITFMHSTLSNIKNKFNNCFVSSTSGCKCMICARYTHIAHKSTHMMSSTRVSCGSEPFPLPVGSNLLLLFFESNRKKEREKSMIQLCVWSGHCIEWMPKPINGKNRFKCYYSPINHTSFDAKMHWRHGVRFV